MKRGIARMVPVPALHMPHPATVPPPTSISTFAEIWVTPTQKEDTGSYTGGQIRIINTFLQRAATAAIPRESDRDRWVAEAHVLRAYFYMELLKWYGPVPIEKEPYGLDYDYSTLSRPTFEDCARFIVDDCEIALQSSNLPWRLTTLNEKIRMTKGIAMAIRSEACLFAASTYNNGGKDLWEWAYTINKDCLEQNESQWI